ncbi:MAG: glycosyltransferase family 4 protein, partial [Candidatus Rokuibacteriota bacterium]
MSGIPDGPDETSGEERMRLLHVVATGTRRGAEVFASDLVGALGRLGIDQRVAVLRSTHRADVRYEAPVFELGSQWRRMWTGFDPWALRRLRVLIDSWRPHVVQAHGGEAFERAVLATIGRNVPVVYRRIGAAPPWLQRLPRRPLYAGLMRRASRVVTVADALRGETVRLFRVPPARVITIPNAVDPARMQVKTGRREMRLALGIPPFAPASVTVGALVREKDPLAHLEVAAEVLRRIPTAVHMFVGDGPLRPQLEAAVVSRNLGDRVRLLGTRDDVADLLAAADVLLFASREGGMEGMPANLIEAGMVGLPVVAYAIAGVPEVIVDGETGFLVRAGDASGLTRRVVELLGNRRLCDEMGRAAGHRCCSLFDIGAIAPRYLGVYEELT